MDIFSIILLTRLRSANNSTASSSSDNSSRFMSDKLLLGPVCMRVNTHRIYIDPGNIKFTQG